MSDRRIVLFAADEVGLATAKIFASEQCTLCGLVLDARDPKGLNSHIVRVAPTVSVLEVERQWPETSLELLRSFAPEFGVLAWWPFLLPPQVLDCAPGGFLNFHPSLLPFNRGKHPNFWSIVEQTPFGVTLHFADRGIDTGDIAFSESIAITWEDTGQTLYERGRKAIVALFQRHFAEIRRGDIPRRRQNLDKGNRHVGAEIEAASIIDLDRHYRARDLINLLRARTFPPHPAAWFEDHGQRFEVRVSIRRLDHLE